MRRLYIDDKRPIPDSTWEKAETSQDARRMILEALESGMPYEEISFDHDLGLLSEKDGWYIADMFEQMAALDSHPKIIWHVHSASPVGAERIRTALQSADKFWDENEKIKLG